MIAQAYYHTIYGHADLKWTEAFLMAGFVSVASMVSICGLYLAKSALGINLMSGPSPLHDLLYWMVA